MGGAHGVWYISALGFETAEQETGNPFKGTGMDAFLAVLESEDNWPDSAQIEHQSNNTSFKMVHLRASKQQQNRQIYPEPLHCDADSMLRFILPLQWFENMTLK